MFSQLMIFDVVLPLFSDSMIHSSGTCQPQVLPRSSNEVRGKNLETPNGQLPLVRHASGNQAKSYMVAPPVVLHLAFVMEIW